MDRTERNNDNSEIEIGHGLQRVEKLVQKSRWRTKVSQRAKAKTRGGELREFPPLHPTWIFPGQGV